MEVPSPAPPLGLLALGDCSDAQLSYALRPNDQLLLYTDGVTEARDAKRAFYPLPERVSALAPRAASHQRAGNQRAGNQRAGNQRAGGQTAGKRAAGMPAAGRRAAGRAALRAASADGDRPGLLDLVRADLHKHVGAPLDDDAALLLVHAPAAWPAGRLTSPPARITA
jgi:hypothetical protein